ncbi:MAG: radical SAM protein [Acidimicrobiia bacterium]|nr:radical SAM protein [Acidimicrobiia bacterium]
MSARPLLERLGPLEGWALSTYERCDIRCDYCITGVQGRSTPRVSAEQAPAQLRSELPALAPRARLGVGALCDAYPNAEAVHGVTRQVVATLVEEQRRFTIITKGTLVRRDLDLLRAADRRCQVVMSIPGIDPDLVRTVDREADSPQARLVAVHEIADAGVRVEVAASPWIPGISDVARLRALVDPAITIRVTPLRLQAARVPWVGKTAFARRHDQQSVNEDYIAEGERLGELAKVTWAPPPELDGTPPHVSVLMGAPRVTPRKDPVAYC